jgi:nitrogen fixation NifU-like protein
LNADIKQLYQEVILDHNRTPRNFRAMENPDFKAEGYNPLCGDRYTIYLRMNGDTIEEIAFQGSGCAISKASASVMTTIVKGVSRERAKELFEQFHKLVKGELRGGEDLESIGKMAVFAGVSEFPARVKCASLAWHTLNAALERQAEPVSTEE